jgi:hypothetical protein
MKKTISIIALVMTLFLMFACTSPREKAIKETITVYENDLSTLEPALNALENAKDGKTAGETLLSIKKGMDDGLAQMETIKKKYPNAVKENETPKELEPVITKFNIVIKKYSETVSNASTKFAADPDFIAAMKIFTKQ